MIPFLPILELLRSYFGLAEQDSGDESRRKIAGTLVLADRSLEAALPLVFEFMGVPDPERRPPRMDPELRQRHLFGALRQMLQARSDREPTVLLIEDLHWIDGGGEAFLEPIIEAATHGRLLVIVTFRPEYHVHWMQKSYYHQLPLLPLGKAAISELVADLLGSDPSLEGLHELIRQRTSGNPFFIEEAVLSLSEAGSLEGERGAYRLARPIDPLQIPDSVQNVLAARIDRLPSREKSVLDAAAVVGKTFSERLLSRLVEISESELLAALRGLVDGEFIHERALYPEAEYAFKHPLTQEVAYASQLAERRSRAHRVVAEAIEELHRDGVEAHAGLVAHHWEQAGDPWRAAQWQDRAAQRAVLTHPGEATRHWLKVRSLLESVPETPEAVVLRVASCTQILNLGWHLGLSDDEVEAIFAEGKVIAERSGDPRSLAALYRAYALSTLIAGSVDESTKWFEEAARLANYADDEGMKVALRTSLILLHVWAGELGRALTEVDGLMEQTADDIWLGAEILGYSPYVWAAFMKGTLLVRTSRLSDGERAFEQALQLARKHGDTFVLGHTYHAQALLEWFRGDLESARARGREAITMFESLGTTNQTAYGYLRLGAAQSLGHEWKESAANLELALSIARQQRLLVSEPEILAHLAEAYLGLGQEHQALATAEEAIRAARDRGTKLHECDAQLALARILLHTEGASAQERIEAVLADVSRLVEETGARVHEPFIRVEYAELARLLGDKATRQRELREAHRLYNEMGAAGYAERVAGQLESVG
jgi:adenylate cyclase